MSNKADTTNFETTCRTCGGKAVGCGDKITCEACDRMAKLEEICPEMAKMYHLIPLGEGYRRAITTRILALAEENERLEFFEKHRQVFRDALRNSGMVMRNNEQGIPMIIPDEEPPCQSE